VSGVDAEVAELVALELGRDSVALGDHLVEDLGAESIDVLNIVTLLEETFAIRIEEERLSSMRTVQDLADEVGRVLGRPGGA
jgi:acyl carrier protein